MNIDETIDALAELLKPISMRSVGNPKSAIFHISIDGREYVASLMPTNLEPLKKSLIKWTTPTLRAELGKHGFNEVSAPVSSGRLTMSVWRRGVETVTLVQPEGYGPYLIGGDGEKIAVEELGTRNINTKGDAVI